jgi:hypothetical protein
MNKVQFKLVVEPVVRDIVRRHAETRGTDMSSTITTLAKEVLLPELTETTGLTASELFPVSSESSLSDPD